MESSSRVPWSPEEKAREGRSSGGGTREMLSVVGAGEMWSGGGGVGEASGRRERGGVRRRRVGSGARRARRESTEYIFVSMDSGKKPEELKGS
jgi:hypothetical protein